MKIAVIGTGSMGKNHVRVLKNIPDVDEIVVSDIDAEQLRSTVEQFAIKKAYQNYIDLLENEKPDGVIIATQPNSHKKIAIDIMKFGTNVLVEKPIAHSLKDAEEMIKILGKKDVIFTVGHVERFNPVVSKIKEFFDRNLLNNVYLVNTHRIGPFPKRLLGKAEGVLIDLAIHDFDIITFFCGKMLEIHSQIIESKNQEIYVRTLIDLENNIKASAEFSWISPRKVRTIEIYGDEGMILGDYLNQEIWFYENDDYDNTSRTNDSFWGSGLIKSGKVIKHPIHKQEPLLLELANFVNSIKGIKTPLVKPEEALLALKNVISIQKPEFIHKSFLGGY